MRASSDAGRCSCGSQEAAQFGRVFEMTMASLLRVELPTIRLKNPNHFANLEGNPVSSVSIVTIKIKNTGGAQISPVDFEYRLEIQTLGTHAPFDSVERK